MSGRQSGGISWDGAGELSRGLYRHVKHFVLCPKSILLAQVIYCVTVCHKLSGLKK